MVSIVSPQEQRVVAKLAAALGVANAEGALSFGKLIPAAEAAAASRGLHRELPREHAPSPALAVS